MVAPVEDKLLTLDDDDNVCVARATLEAGEPVEIDGCVYVLAERVAIGHKVARCAIEAGAAVLKYGARIGTASAAIEPGRHVHGHNLASDYYPSHTHDGARAAVGASEE